LIEVVNAFVDGNALLVTERVGSEMRKLRLRPEYSFFVRASDLDEDFAAMLRGSRALLAMKREGDWVRLCWADEWTRKAMVRGRKAQKNWSRAGEEEKAEPSPFQQRGIQTFEGDVDPVCRWLTDTPDARIARARRGYGDLETDSRCTIVEAKQGKARVVAIGLSSEDETFQWKDVLREWTDAEERRIIEGFFAQATQCGFDQLLFWNGEDFDFEVLSKRIERLGLDVDMRMKLWLDHMVLFRRMNLNSSDSGAEKQSMALQAIAQSQIGEGKEEIPPEVAARWPGRSLGSLTYELWEAGGWFRDLLVRYCMKDVLLMPRIERKTGFVALFDTLCDACRVLPDSRGLLPTRQMDGFMLPLAAARGHRFPTREWTDEESKPFAGAFVMAPKIRGIAREVHVVDFASLYPSIILTWNMSPETKARDLPVNGPIPEGYCRSPKTGTGFSTAVDGILPIALREMIRLRKEWSEKAAKLPPGTPEAKEAQRWSMAYKVAANSFYGVVGSPFSRFYDRSVAESVTQNGVWLIQETISAAEERGMRAVYGDTDSAFFQGASQTEVEAFVKWCNEELYPSLLAKVGCRKEHVAIKLAYEKAFERIVIVEKKRYAGVFRHYKGTLAKPMPAIGEAFDPARHSRPEIKGLEFKRGDATVLARQLQEAVIMDMMRGVERLADYRSHLERALAHVCTEDLPIGEVQQVKSLSKRPKDYHRKTPTGKDAEVPPHVKVAERIEAAGKSLGEGARVAYVVVDGSDGIEAISAEEYRGECDRYYLWEKLVYPPTMRVLEAAFPDEDWQTGLEKIRPKKQKPTADQRAVAKADAVGQASLFTALGDPALANPAPPVAASSEAKTTEGGAAVLSQELEWEMRWRE